METIAAISTPTGNGGIGIVRISGDKSLEIIKKIFKSKNIIKENTIKYGKIIDSEGKIIDEVLVSYFKSPKTYTGEDICEINCHGGIVSTKQILDLVLKNGAKIAGPGEFTKRAFLNGKLDLAEAEAVIDIINSRTTKENEESQKQLQGFLSKKIVEIKVSLIDLLVDIEANIDYPEYDIEEVRREKMLTVLEDSRFKLLELEKSFESGKILKDGISTAIIGRPNVGKSSLLNALLKEDRAIVTAVAGTTRDTIEEYINLKGVPLKIIDTAGIRNTQDIVEEIGVEKSKKALESSNLILMIVDATSLLTDEDFVLFDKIKAKKHIIIINKKDIGDKISKKDINDENVIEISAKNFDGIEELENTIKDMFELGNIESDNTLLITNVRHKNLITVARQGIELAIKSLKEGLPIDMISINLQNSVQNLGEIIGENVSEDVISGIFSKFCVGK